LPRRRTKNIASINVLQRQLSKPMEKLRHRMRAVHPDGRPLLVMAVHPAAPRAWSGVRRLNRGKDYLKK
jgi:hypothetical protein